MKPIRLTHHAREQCVERGASEDEVKQAVINGSRETAKSIESYADTTFSLDNHGTGKDIKSSKLPLSSKKPRQKRSLLQFTRFSFERRKR